MSTYSPFLTHRLLGFCSSCNPTAGCGELSQKSTPLPPLFVALPTAFHEPSGDRQSTELRAAYSAKNRCAPAAVCAPEATNQLGAEKKGHRRAAALPVHHSRSWAPPSRHCHTACQCACPTAE